MPLESFRGDRGIGQIVWPVSNLKAAEIFYVNVLGFSALYSIGNADQPSLICIAMRHRCGGTLKETRLLLIEEPGLCRPVRQRHPDLADFFDLEIAVDNINEYSSRLDRFEELGVALQTPYFDERGMYSRMGFWIEDFDQRRILFTNLRFEERGNETGTGSDLA